MDSLKSDGIVSQPSRRTRAASRRFAFTIVELLVVISIIVILIAMMLPSLGKSKETAILTLCQTRLKAVHLASYSYAVDSKGYFPYRTPGTYMIHQIKGVTFDLNKWATQYLNGRYPNAFCPSRLHDVRNPVVFPSYQDTYFTYQYCNYNGTGWTVPKVNLEKENAPGRYALWSCLTTLKDSSNWLGHDAPETPVEPRGQNAAKIDGSAAWHAKRDMEMFVFVSSHQFWWPVR